MFFLFACLSSGDASDSICPKGWGIAKYDGDGSYYKLIKNAYVIKNLQLGQKYENYKQLVRYNEIILQSIFNINRSGDYSYANRIEYRSQSGNMWEKGVYSNIRGQGFRFYNTYIFLQNYGTKGSGFSLRSVAK